MASHAALPIRTDQSGVSTLELFFDLGFVLAIAQCTTLMSHQPSWTGLGRGLVVLALLWWAWVGYSWLTSVVNPEHVRVRLPMFAATIALAVAALCVPRAFGDLAMLFVGAYAIVRFGHIALMLAASTDHRGMWRASSGLAVSTAIGVGLLTWGATLDAHAQLIVWAVAAALDIGGPLVIEAEGWRLTPSHFAERHGLIVIIALGESVLAIGVGAAHPEHLGTLAAVLLGAIAACCMWWVYFDMLALVAERALSRASAGREQNAMARDAYSYIHYGLIAGIVLVALGFKKALGHVEEPLTTVGAAALIGGVAIYFASITAFGKRTTGLLARDSLVVAVVFAALIPVGTRVDGWIAITVLAALLVLVVVYKAVHYSEGRRRVRGRMLSTDD